MFDLTADVALVETKIRSLCNQVHHSAASCLLIVHNNEDLAQIVDACGVYFIYERPRLGKSPWSLVYIGTEKKVRKRIRQHLFYKIGTGTGHKGYRVPDNLHLEYGVLWHYVRPVDLREFIEHIAIDELSPRDNSHS